MLHLSWDWKTIQKVIEIFCNPPLVGSLPLDCSNLTIARSFSCHYVIICSPRVRTWWLYELKTLMAKLISRITTVPIGFVLIVLSPVLHLSNDLHYFLLNVHDKIVNDFYYILNEFICIWQFQIVHQLNRHIYRMLFDVSSHLTPYWNAIWRYVSMI